MMDLMYRIPSDDTIESCTITKESVDGTAEPVIAYKGGKKNKKDSA